SSPTTGTRAPPATSVTPAADSTATGRASARSRVAPRTRSTLPCAWSVPEWCAATCSRRNTGRNRSGPGRAELSRSNHDWEVWMEAKDLAQELLKLRDTELPRLRKVDRYLRGDHESVYVPAAARDEFHWIV